MGELLEIVMEGILRSKVYQVLSVLLRCAGSINNIQCSEALVFSKKGELTEQDIENFLCLSVDASLLINLRYLRVNNVIVSSVLLRVIKYGDHIDIDFNFEEQDITGMDTKYLMQEVHSFITKISEEYKVDHWFGGMEPASDEDTRYFTDKDPGPLA